MSQARPQLWLCLDCGRAGKVPVEEGDSQTLIYMKVGDAHRFGILHPCAGDVQLVNHDLEADKHLGDLALATWIGRYNKMKQAEARQRVRAERAEREFLGLYRYLSHNEFAADGLVGLDERNVLNLSMGEVDRFIDILRQGEFEEIAQTDIVEETEL